MSKKINLERIRKKEYMQFGLHTFENYHKFRFFMV